MEHSRSCIPWPSLPPELMNDFETFAPSKNTFNVKKFGLDTYSKSFTLKLSFLSLLHHRYVPFSRALMNHEIIVFIN
jgi:hypothetical protein